MDRDVVNLAMFGMHQHLSTHAADKINCVIARVEDRRRVNGVADKGRNYQCEARAWVGAHGCSPPLHRRERYSVSQSPAPCHRAVAGDQSVIEHAARESEQYRSPANLKTGQLRTITMRSGAGSGSNGTAQLRLISGSSCRTKFSREVWTFMVPLYSMNPSLRNLFMKWLTRDHHFCERLLADLRDARPWFPLVAKLRHDEQQPRQTPLARIEKLIDQVLFHPGISGQEESQKHLGQRTKSATTKALT